MIKARVQLFTDVISYPTAWVSESWNRLPLSTSLEQRVLKILVLMNVMSMYLICVITRMVLFLFLNRVLVQMILL